MDRQDHGTATDGYRGRIPVLARLGAGELRRVSPVQLRGMHLFVLVVTFVTFVAAAGCATTADPVTDEERAEMRRKVAAVQILDPSEIEGKQYEILGEVEGTACTYSRGLLTGKGKQEPGTPEAAKESSRYRAANLGADAVTNFVCAPTASFDALDPCKQRIRCTGDAIRFLRPPSQ